MNIKISIITPSFNQGPYIEQTIRSVLAQKYCEFEHIIIDGGSTDGTVEILKKYPHLIWISESDKGQADALNKGLNLVTGNIVGWINSDDYYEKEIFDSVVRNFRNPKTAWVIGNLNFYYEGSGDVVQENSPVISYRNLINDPDIVRQLPTFFRTRFLRQSGGWNSKYFMVMDYDLWLRLSKLETPKMVNESWGYFRLHALQKTSSGNILRQCCEIVEILRREHVSSYAIVKVKIWKRWEWLKGLVKTVLLNRRIFENKL